MDTLAIEVEIDEVARPVDAVVVEVRAEVRQVIDPASVAAVIAPVFPIMQRDV